MANEVMVQSERQVDNQGFMRINSLDEAIRCSELIASSSFCPAKMMNKPGDVLIALQMGQELGLKPMQALQNIAVVNGRPSVWGDAMLAIIRQSSDFEFIDEQDDGETATCTIKRRNEPPVVRTFSMTDAKIAGLANKEGPWRTYPKRMRQMRARGFAARDSFPDLLKGIVIKEEAEDMPVEKKDYSYAGEYVRTLKGEEPLINNDQMVILREKILECQTTEENVCKRLNIINISEMRASQWMGMCGLLDKKIEEKNRLKKLEINKAFEVDSTPVATQSKE